MRDIVPFLLIVSALGTNCPAMAQDAPHCALDAPAQVIKLADAGGAPASEPSAAKSAEAPEAEAAAELKPAANWPGATVLAAPSDVERVPVLKHIAGAGAKLLELGAAHGLRSVSALRGEQFMLLQVAPDGEAVVSGPQLDLSVSTLMTVAGGQVTELGEAHGLRGLYLRNGQEFQVLYATPDGNATIAGVMWDATGKNLTREQAARIDGAVPTVVVGKDPASAPTVAKPALDIVQKTTFGLSGNADAPRLWMFVDPLCSYSVRALQQLKPYVEQGRIQLALIPISVLDYEDKGQSTPATLALLSKAPDQMAAAWSYRDFGGAPAAEASARLQANMTVAEAMGLRGTPTLIWRKADGTAGRIDGLPNDWSAIFASMGGDNHVAGAR